LIVAAWAQLYHIESVISLATIAAASLLITAMGDRFSRPFHLRGGGRIRRLATP
jgi:hypothetical protein